MYNTIYEAEEFYGINPVFIVLCIVIIVIILALIVLWKKIDVGVRFLSAFVIVFLLMMVISQVYVSVDSKHKLYDEYIKGNYLVVEGPIENYILAEEGQPNLPDQFEVKGVEFSTPGFVSCWGYPLKTTTGSVLKEGMKVKIYYIPYKFENVIMKIEGKS